MQISFKITKKYIIMQKKNLTKHIAYLYGSLVNSDDP